jgi:hypothetical protein
VSDQLLSSDLVGNDKRFAQRLASILEFTQILFDDDENLTRVESLDDADAANRDDEDDEAQE